MTVERTPDRAPAPLYVQNDPRDLAPAGAVRMGIEHAQMDDEMGSSCRVSA
jgi:hypothetical protein